MNRFSNFSTFCIIILIVNLEALGKKTKQHSTACNKCGRRMPALEGLRGAERIINGRQVQPPFKYPWIVKVEADRTCSGSIISKKYILTSAYCLTKSESDNDPKCKEGKLPKECYVQNSNMKLRLPWRDSAKFRKTLQAGKLIPHPDYKHPAEKNDIALIQVSQGIECNSFHQPICLPTENLNKFGGKLIVTGWGQVTPDGRTAKFRKTLQVEKLLPHPDYKHPAEKNDIALIQVSQGIECNSFHQPICLPTENLNKFGGKLIVTGWGQVTPDGRTDGSKVLREGEMKQVKFSYCKLIPVNSSNVICVVGTNGAQMPCRGDSGAAIFAAFNKAYYALGITSLPEVNPPKCQPSKPLTHTRVHAYMDWIKKYEKQFPEPYKHFVKVEDIETDQESAEPYYIG